MYSNLSRGNPLGNEIRSVSENSLALYILTSFSSISHLQGQSAKQRKVELENNNARLSFSIIIIAFSVLMDC